jgi:hypothetical protein
MKREIKSCWVTKQGVGKYNKKAHSKKTWNFLYWKKERLLIAGNGQYGTGFGSYEKLIKCFQDQNDRRVPDNDPDGLGVIMEINGRDHAIFWNHDLHDRFSGIKTSENLCHTIQVAVGLPELW